MKQRLVALATALVATGAGTLLFVNWDTGQPAQPRRGGFEIIDCSPPTACAAPACVQAQNHLNDAGFPACSPRLVECEVRVGQAARNWASDAGLELAPKPYQSVRLVGMRCPGADGGFAFGIPLDDDNLPQFKSIAASTPPCVRAPVGNTTCLRDPPGAEPARFIGELNVFPATEASGTGCEPVGCRLFFGDSDL